MDFESQELLGIAPILSIASGSSNEEEGEEEKHYIRTYGSVECEDMVADNYRPLSLFDTSAILKPHHESPRRKIADEHANTAVDYDRNLPSGQNNINNIDGDNEEFSRKSYWKICLLFMIYSVSFGVAIPALPGVVLDVTKGDSFLSAIYYGAATFFRYFLEFFSAPILGTLADIKGRKLVLLISFSVCALELLLLGLVPSIPMLFIARGLSGLGDVGASTTYTIITDISAHNEDNVTQKYGLVGAMMGLAFIVGPLVGGYLCEFSIRACLIVAGTLAAMGAILVVFILEETILIAPYEHRSSPLGNEALLQMQQEVRISNKTNEEREDLLSDCPGLPTSKDIELPGYQNHPTEFRHPNESEVPPPIVPAAANGGIGKSAVSKAEFTKWQIKQETVGQGAISWTGLKGALLRYLSALQLHFNNEALRVLTVPYILCTMAGGYVFIWYMYMDYQFNSSPSNIGLYLSFNGLISAIVQGVILPALTPRYWSELFAARCGLLLAAIHVALYPFCFVERSLYALAVLLCLSSTYFPAVKAIIVVEALKQRGARYVLGNLQGVLGSLSTLAMAGGSLLFSLLFSYGVLLSRYSTSADNETVYYVHPKLSFATMLPFGVSAALYLASLVSLHLVSLKDPTLSSR